MMITSNSLQFFSEKLLSDIAPLFFAAALGELVILFPSWLLRDTATLRGSFIPSFIPNHVANWPNKLQIGPPAVPYMYI